MSIYGGAGALGMYMGAVTLNSELDEASSFPVRVDGVTGKENGVLALCWLQLWRGDGRTANMKEIKNPVFEQANAAEHSFVIKRQLNETVLHLARVVFS